ncbi:MAG: DedA family protein [Corynebacterium variabile]|uniref:DedA family protein n=1 Tax=Corynebacterium variabile TaxID=1727 RepID=UPI0026489828|nr:DedA family protein [Corynebacterium variabile]MDN6537034.1 DedA family protein [Corynebacterium variabile]
MFDVDNLLSSFGLAGIMIIIFMETGILIGFIFPGDTLLFTAGIMAASDNPFAPLWALCLCIPMAAVIGDQVGYTLGRRYGQAALESRVLNWIGPDAVTKTEEFFSRYGPFTVLIARFIAVVRTLAPLVAGIAKMPRAAFTFWSVIGCFAWGAGITVLGFLLGGIPFVRDYLDLIVIVGVGAVLLPVVVKVTRMQLHARRERRNMRQRFAGDSDAEGQ